MVGENNSYIYIRKGSLVVGDEYSVLITREDGSQMFSCPLVAQPFKECCETPTVIQQGDKIIINLQKATATVRLITTTGIVLWSKNIAETRNEIIAPTQQGVYILEILTSTNLREVVKIVVK